MVAEKSNGAAVTAPLLLTPRQVEGPHYPTQKLVDRDNDLTRVENGDTVQGQVLVLSGRLVSESHTPILAARIES